MFLAVTQKWTIRTVTQKWTIRTFFTKEHFLGKLFLHKLVQDGSKHVTKLLHFVDYYSKGAHIRSILFSIRPTTGSILLGHFQSSAGQNKMQVILNHSVTR
jgi:hypothetical protein